MIRSMLRQRAVALVAIGGIASVGVQPLAAAAAEGRTGTRKTPMGHWVVQQIDMKGNTKTVSGPRAGEGGLPQMPSAAEIGQARRDLLAQSRNVNPKLAASAERMLRILDIVTTQNPAERHAKIQKLDVTVTMQPSSDGRTGTVKTFSAAGRPRLRVFVPRQGSDIANVVHGFNEPAGGPSLESDETGRWKLDGQGGCYWDAYDDGPDQCTPPSGRWKLNGDGGCYWDANDDGPDQCVSTDGGRWASDGNGGCYFANELGPDQCTPPDTGSTCWDDHYQASGPCATQQVLDDAYATLVALEAEAEMYQIAYDEENAALDAYCNQNPGSCEPDEEEDVVSGPFANDRASCRVEGADAAVSVGEMTVGAIAGYTALATGAVVTTGGAALIVAGVFFLAYRAGRAVRDFVECRRALPRLPEILIYEPQHVY